MIKKLFNIKYPIIQAPMLGVTTPEMVAKSSNCGIMGSLALGGLSSQQTRELIKKTKSITNKRFSVNLFVDDLNKIKKDQNDYKIMKDFLYNNNNNNNFLPIEVLNKIKLQQDSSNNNNNNFLPEFVDELKLYNYQDQINVILEEGIDIISFTFGIMDKESIAKIKSFNSNSILIGTATCLEEAKILEDYGIDIICAQGIEAGGHRGSFIQGDMNTSIDSLPQIALLPLVTSLLENCKVPIIAAGSITNKTTIDSLISMGVAGVQIGSLFIASNESCAINSWKDAIINSTDTSTSLTRSFSGRWARGIKNQFMENFNNQLSIKIPPYPIQNELTKPLRSISQKDNNNQFTNLWSGQQGYKSKKLPIEQIIKELI
ncbi:hypothetical protein ACTFIZ_009714 [Dictyostelium cf. discoideum]